MVAPLLSGPRTAEVWLGGIRAMAMPPSGWVDSVSETHRRYRSCSAESPDFWPLFLGHRVGMTATCRRSGGYVFRGAIPAVGHFVRTAVVLVSGNSGSVLLRVARLP